MILPFKFIKICTLCSGVLFWLTFFERDDFTPVLHDKIPFFKSLGSKHSPSYEYKDAYKLELLHRLNFTCTMTTSCKLSNGWWTTSCISRCLLARGVHFSFVRKDMCYDTIQGRYNLIWNDLMRFDSMF